MKFLAIPLTLVFSGCSATGGAKLKVCAIDQRTHTPITNKIVTAQYQTVVFGPIARPHRIEKTSDEYGCVQFDKLADGAWTIRIPSRSGQVQEAYFSIYEGRIRCDPKPGSPPWAPTSPPWAPTGTEVSTIEDGFCIGVVAGNLYATPTSPVIFHGSLAQ